MRGLLQSEIRTVECEGEEQAKEGDCERGNCKGKESERALCTGRDTVKPERVREENREGGPGPIRR